MNRRVEKHRLAQICSALSRAGNRLDRVVGALLLLFALPLAFTAPSVCQSADWTLIAPQLEQVKTGAIVAEGDVAPDRAAADIRAAIRIAAPPEQVFRTLTDCARALKFVPHLKRCAVLETAPDGSWQNVEQQVDYSWLVPRAHYVFHAEYEKFASIRFS